MASVARMVSGPRTKWVVAAAWFALLAGFVPLSGKLEHELKDESTALLPTGSESKRVTNILRQRFPGGDRSPVLVVYQRTGGLTAADAARIASDARRAASVPLVGPGIASFLPGRGPDAAPIPLAPGRSPGSDVAATVAPLQNGHGAEEAKKAVDRLRRLEPHSSAGLTVHVTGAPALLNDITYAVQGADVKLLVATAGLVLLLLFAIYRSVLLAVLPLVVVGIAYTVATGIIDLLARSGLQVDPTAVSLLVVLMFGAGTDYSLFLVAQYSSDLRQVEDEHEALATAMSRASPAIIASGATVISAMLVLLVSTLGTNRALGPVMAVGVAVVLLASVTLLPALLAIVGRRGFWPSMARVEPVRAPPGLERWRLDGGGDVLVFARTEEQARWVEGHLTKARRSTRWERIAAAVLARPARALTIGLLVLAVGALGLLVYAPSANSVAQFRTASDSARGFETFQKGFAAGAGAPMIAIVESSTGPVTRAQLETVQRVILSTPGVARVLPGSDPRSRDREAASLTVVLRGDPFATAALNRVKHLRAELKSVAPGVRVLLGDGSAARLDNSAAATHDTKLILPLVLAVILIILMLLLRAVIAPLYVLGTVVLSFLGTFGASLLVFKLGFGQSSFDTVLPIVTFIFLVALGVDYNIFLMARVREEAAAHGTVEGIRRSLIATGPVITNAGLILAGTFLVLTTLPVYILLEIGFAVAFGVLVDTFLVRSIILPAIVALVGNRSWWPSRLDM